MRQGVRTFARWKSPSSLAQASGINDLEAVRAVSFETPVSLLSSFASCFSFGRRTTVRGVLGNRSTTTALLASKAGVRLARWDEALERCMAELADALTP
jgi:hypothetical protein